MAFLVIIIVFPQLILNFLDIVMNTYEHTIHNDWSSPNESPKILLMSMSGL